MTAGFYFGCISSVGHFFYGPSGGPRRLPRLRASMDAPTGCPWERVDNALTPKTDRRQGAAALHHKGNWSALAIHDFTVDDRPGSNSVFLFPEPDLDLEQILNRARAHFPTVVARIGKILVVEP